MRGAPIAPLDEGGMLNSMNDAGIAALRDTFGVSDEELRKMVGPDPHRPGAARFRLIAEQIPIWAIMGQLRVVSDSVDAHGVTAADVRQIALDFDIRPVAVLAALRYYEHHRDAIEALLEANAAMTV
jgi:hypothetical protein